MEYLCASAKATHEFSFLLTASPRGPIPEPRDRTINQLRQTRGRNVHKTVLYRGLPQPKPFCITPSNDSTSPTNIQTKELCLRKSERGPRIDLSKSEGIRWHQVLEDGGVAPVSRTQCDHLTSNNFRGVPRDTGVPRHQRSPILPAFKTRGRTWHPPGDCRTSRATLIPMV